MKKALKLSGLILLALLCIAFALPFLFKGKITSLIKDQINQRLVARVDFSDVDLSLFRHFPRLSVAMDDLQVIGSGEFASDTLVAARRIDVAVDLWSVIGGKQLLIHSIAIDQPRIHALIHPNGHVNWLIMRPDTAVAPPEQGAKGSAFAMALQKYTITNGYLEYRDDSSKISTEITGINHSGGGDFSSDAFVLNTNTTVESLSFSYGLIPYLVKVRTKMSVDFQVDNKIGKYSFRTDDLSLNDLQLHTEGWFQLVNDSTYDMDIKFNGPSLDFKHILSLVPALYKNNFAGVRTSGQASLDGYVRGRYDSRHMPAYHVALGVKDGSFQYPDLPLPVKNINLSLLADNPDGVPDHAEVNITRGHIEMDDAPLDFRLLVKTPVSDPYLDLAAKGQLDLGKVSKFVKLEAGTRLAGLLNADMSMKGNLSAVQNQKIGQFDAAGSLGLTGFAYSSAAYPSGINLERVQMSFNPKNITLGELKGVYGKTHFSAHGTLNNLPVYILKHKPLDGSLVVQADEVNLNDLMGGSAAPAAKTDSAAVKATTALAVPANINFVVSAGVDRVLYDRLLLEQVTGNLIIADETVTLQNVKARALDGSLAISGVYSTKNGVQHPEISFSYDVQQLDIQKTYAAFTPLQQLMPAAKYIAGTFSSQLELKGSLGADMKPDMGSLTGGGRLQLANGALKGFAPTDQLAQVLRLDELKDITLKDIKTSFAFRNGRVIVDPFPIRLKDIDMEVGGTHGFDQTLDYSIDMKLPRAMLGGDINKLANSVNIGLKDKIDLPIGVGGTTTKPIIKADIKGALAGTAAGLRQQATDLVKAKVDSAKQQLRDTARAVGQQVARDAAEELRRRLTGPKDSGVATIEGVDTGTKKRLQSAGKSLLDGLFNKKKSN